MRGSTWRLEAPERVSASSLAKGAMRLSAMNSAALCSQAAVQAAVRLCITHLETAQQRGGGGIKRIEAVGIGAAAGGAALACAQHLDSLAEVARAARACTAAGGACTWGGESAGGDGAKEQCTKQRGVGGGGTIRAALTCTADGAVPAGAQCLGKLQVVAAPAHHHYAQGDTNAR